MSFINADIVAQLQKDILPFQGFKPMAKSANAGILPGVIEHAFPNQSFPLAAVHEFFCSGAEDVAATNGFIAGILGKIMNNGVSLWISSTTIIFPPALKAFGIEPEKIIFVRLQKQKDILWVMEEALKCAGLAAVVAELQEISFTESRRLQLAVEQSSTTGFIVRNNPRNLSTTCISRWRVTSVSSYPEQDMPGIGLPRWNVELLKVRNGKPGTWQIEWAAGQFRHIRRYHLMIAEEERKAG